MHNSGKAQKRRIAPEHIRIELVRTELLPVSIAFYTGRRMVPEGLSPISSLPLSGGLDSPRDSNGPTSARLTDERMALRIERRTHSP